MLFPGSGGHMRVVAVPRARDLTRAVNGRLEQAGSKVRGVVVRRGDSWVFQVSQKTHLPT